MIPFDIEDIFGSALGSVVRQVLLAVAALVVGGFVAGAALEGARWMVNGMTGFRLSTALAGPAAESWLAMLLSGLAGAIGLGMLVKADAPGVWSWGALAGAVATVQLGTGMVFGVIGPGWELGLTLGFFAILLAMLGVGLWWLERWQRNRWAASLEAIRAENAERRARMKEEFGTESIAREEEQPWE